MDPTITFNLFCPYLYSVGINLCVSNTFANFLHLSMNIVCSLCAIPNHILSIRADDVCRCTIAILSDSISWIAVSQHNNTLVGDIFHRIHTQQILCKLQTSFHIGTAVSTEVFDFSTALSAFLHIRPVFYHFGSVLFIVFIFPVITFLKTTEFNNRNLTLRIFISKAFNKRLCSFLGST